MNDFATPTVATTPDPSLRPVRGFGRRLFRRLLVLPRYVRRKPGRAVLLVALGLLVVGSLTAGGLWIWFDQHLKAARVALDKGHNADAVRHLRHCQWLRPEHREVLLLSSRAARRAGSSEEADAYLTQYWQRYGDDEQLVFERLLHRAAKGELEGVGPGLRARIVQGGPQARLAREALVAGLTYRFRWLEARGVLEEWVTDTPDDTLALIQYGKYFEQQLAFDDAMRSYRRVIELDPEQLEARLRLATILVTRRYGEEAAQELALLRDKLPDHPEVQVLRARALSLLGRTEEARAAIEACLALHPDYPPALLERGSAALLEGDEQGAEQFLARAARLDPGNTQVRNLYALVLGRNRKPEQAAAEYATARQLEGDGERITEIVRGPLQSRPNDPALHHEIGMIALRSGLVREAIRWFTSALQVDPDYLPTHRTLTVLYQELDNPALAARHRAMAQRLSAQQRKP